MLVSPPNYISLSGLVPMVSKHQSLLTTYLILQVNDFAHAIINELSLRLDHSITLLSAAVEPSRVHLAAGVVSERTRMGRRSQSTNYCPPTHFYK